MSAAVPSAVAASIFTGDPIGTFESSPSVWDNNLQAECPPNANCGVIVSFPLWSLSGGQTRLTNSLPPQNETSYFEIVYALSGIDSGRSCPGSPALENGTAMVCYLPDSMNKTDPQIPNCPTVPKLWLDNIFGSVVTTLSYGRNNSDTGN